MHRACLGRGQLQFCYLNTRWSHPLRTPSWFQRALEGLSISTLGPAYHFWVEHMSSWASLRLLCEVDACTLQVVGCLQGWPQSPQAAHVTLDASQQEVKSISLPPESGLVLHLL